MKKKNDFLTPSNLAQFETGGTPAIPARPTEEVLPPDVAGPPAPATAGQAAVPGRIDPQALLAGAVRAGVVDPLAFAKEQITANQPKFAPSRSPGYFQNGQWVATPENQPAPAVSPLARLQNERDAIAARNPNDPRLKQYDQYIAKLSTHAPAASTNVYSGSVTPGVDAQGNSVFIQPSPKADTPPRVVEGVFPPDRVDQRKAAAADIEQGNLARSVRQRITKMSALIQQNPTSVGLAGAARRVGEAVSGVGESLGTPAVPTPAIDFQNEQALLLADVRRLVEKDPNLSKDERERLYQTLGGGMFQTPSSAVRALQGVLQYVESKKKTPSQGRARSLARPKTETEFNALPSGAEYIDPDDGKPYRKP